MNASDASAIAGVDLGNRISVAVAAKALDAQREQGGQVVELIRQAGEVGEQARRSAEAASRGGVDVVG